MTEKQERAQQKRDAAIEKFNAAIEQLQDSDSYRAWLTMRAKFHNYSFRNCVLIWAQFPEATHVAGYRAWQNDFERQVRKGEKGIVILRPIMVRCRPDDDDYAVGEDGKPKLRVRGFGTTTVFDVSQTEGKELPAGPSASRPDGDSHIMHWETLVAYAQTLGYSVEVCAIDQGNGFCRSSTKEICVSEALAPNGRVATLIHELVHAQGVDYKVFTRPQAETIAEGAAFIVGQGIGLDLSDYSVAYVAGWSKTADREFAFAFIDYYAACLEQVLGLRTSIPARPRNPQNPQEEAGALEVAA